MDENTKHNPGTMVGVDVGATGVRVGVVDSAGHVIERLKMATPRDPAECAQTIAAAVRSVCATSNQSLPRVVGLGVPGPVSGDRITAAVNLGWQDVPLAAMVENQLGAPAVMINDVNAAALAEQRLGSAAGERDMIAIWIGTGVGGGAVLGGKVFLGVEGVAVEVGHAIIDVNGLDGARTLEQCASRRAIERGVQERIEVGEASSVRDATPEAIAEGYRQGDRVCVEVVDRALALVGSAAASACAVLGPNAVVIGGALVEAIGPAVARGVGQAANADAFPPGRTLSVRQSALGDDAGLVGAALFAAESAADTMAR